MDTWQRGMTQVSTHANCFQQDPPPPMYKQTTQQNSKMMAVGNGGDSGGLGVMYPGFGYVSYPQPRNGLNSIAFQSTREDIGLTYYNSVGTVTKINKTCGIVNDEVFFNRKVCKGLAPELGDRVLFEASYTSVCQFKWTATLIQVMPSIGSSDRQIVNSDKRAYSAVAPPNEYQRARIVQRHISPRRISPRHISPRRISPRYISPSRISPRYISPRRISPRYISPRHISPRRISPRHISPRRISPRYISPRRISPRYISPRHISPRRISPRHISPRRISPRNISPRRISPRYISPRHISPRRISPRHISPRRISPTHISPWRISPVRGGDFSMRHERDRHERDREKERQHSRCRDEERERKRRRGYRERERSRERLNTTSSARHMEDGATSRADRERERRRVSSERRRKSSERRRKSSERRRKSSQRRRESNQRIRKRQRKNAKERRRKRQSLEVESRRQSDAVEDELLTSSREDITKLQSTSKSALASKQTRKVDKLLSNKLIKSRYQRACIILKKIELNKRAGINISRDKLDKVNCQKVLESYKQWKDGKKISRPTARIWLPKPCDLSNEKFMQVLKIQNPQVTMNDWQILPEMKIKPMILLSIKEENIKELQKLRNRLMFGTKQVKIKIFEDEVMNTCSLPEDIDEVNDTTQA